MTPRSVPGTTPGTGSRRSLPSGTPRSNFRDTCVKRASFLRLQQSAGLRSSLQQTAENELRARRNALCATRLVANVHRALSALFGLVICLQAQHWWQSPQRPRRRPPRAPAPVNRRDRAPTQPQSQPDERGGGWTGLCRALPPPEHPPYFPASLHGRGAATWRWLGSLETPLRGMAGTNNRACSDRLGAAALRRLPLDACMPSGERTGPLQSPFRL